MLTPWKESYDQPRQHIKKQRHYFANKGLSSQGYGFSSSQVWIWELDYKESWVPKNWCFWTMVLEKTLERTTRRSNQFILKEINPGCSLEGLMLKLKTPVLWLPDAKSWLIRKNPSAGNDWRQEEGDNRGWDGWMAYPTQWAWVWASSGRCKGQGSLQSMGSQSQIRLSF